MYKSCNKEGASAENGFTLLEVVFTIFFLGFAMGTLSHLFAGRNVSAASFVNVAWATQLAQEKVEEIYGAKSTNGYSAVNTTNFPASPEDLTAHGYPGWTRQIVIEYAPTNNLDGTSATDTGIKRAEVTVAWPGGSSRTLSAIFSNWP